jgi:hypothetical protein
MKAGTANEFDSAGEEPAGSVVRDGIFYSAADSVNQFAGMGSTLCIDRNMHPSDDVDLDPRNLLDRAVLHRHQRRAFDTIFTDVAALKVAAKHDVRVTMKYRTLMNMRERPVFISLVDKITEAARCVVGVTVHSSESCMKNANVE